MAHPQVLEAAVIAVPHPTWVERPLACVVPKPEYCSSLKAADILGVSHLLHMTSLARDPGS